MQGTKEQPDILRGHFNSPEGIKVLNKMLDLVMRYDAYRSEYDPNEGLYFIAQLELVKEIAQRSGLKLKIG